MLHSSDENRTATPQFDSVRWALLRAFARTTTAALVVFIGLAWGGLMLYNQLSEQPLLPAGVSLAVEQWVWVVLILVLSFAIALLLAVFSGGLRETRAWRRRVETLIDAATLWANGRLGHRIVERGSDDEIHELAVSLNGMAERLEEQVVALQRLVEENEVLARQSAGLATMEERARLARDLHDSVSQLLYALGMTAGAASKLIEQNPEKAKPFVLQTEQMAAKAQAEMRGLLLHLKPVELEGRSVHEALERFLHDVCPRHGIRYDLEVDVEGRLGEGLEAHLFRIAQEAVSNVIRHASAQALQVHVVEAGGRLLLSIHDDGKGFDPHNVRDGSYGLAGIRERAEELGGKFDLRTSPGQGTELRVTLSRLAD